MRLVPVRMTPGERIYDCFTDETIDLMNIISDKAKEDSKEENLTKGYSEIAVTKDSAIKDDIHDNSSKAISKLRAEKAQEKKKK